MSLYNIVRLTKNPTITTVNPNIHGIFILLCLFTFYFSLLGDYYKEPSRRISQYTTMVLGISVFLLNYLAITFNDVFIKVLSKIDNIALIPPNLLIGNIRVVTFLVPASITIPILFLSLDSLRDNQSKRALREYEVEFLLPLVHKSNDTTIDIKICHNFDTGMPCIVPEKILYEHTWVQGGSGSGKTSSFLLPLEEQLLRKKAYLTNKLKEKAIYCLENKIAIINKPITNKWFNANFDLDLIEPMEGKEEEFYNVFKDYLIGTIKSDKIVYKNNFTNDISFTLKNLKNKDFKYVIQIEKFKDGLLYDEVEFEIRKGKEVTSKDIDFLKIETNIINNIHENISIEVKSNEENVNNENTFIDSDKVKVNYSLNEDNSIIKVELKDVDTNYNYNVKASLKGNGRFVPRNLGMTVIAPDGELANTTVELARDYGIKVHKLDPFMDEINKGTVSTFNPLIGDSPEKIGDIVASILVSMDQGSASKTNPYFTNASVRAVRNLVILLKVAYPELYGREPTLEDVLICLNDFNAVKEPIEHIKHDRLLHNKWSGIIRYFEAHFMDKPKDHNNNNAKNSFIGSQVDETKKAISGIINQLDNLLSREEIRYIIANSSKPSINLTEILKKGECMAISTRQGNLGQRLGRAFALFFILSIQNEVLSRYSEHENPEIPHFLIIDEFPMYCNENTETFFSFARKYKCSVTIAIQNMGQLKTVSDEFGETVFTNTSTRLLLPKSNLEDRKYWSEFFGKTKEMQMMTGISTNSVFANNPNYSESIRGSISEVNNVSEEDIDNLNFQQLYYIYTDHKGRRAVGKGTTDFMEKSIEDYMSKTYDFEPYCISKKDYEKKIEIKNNIEKFHESKKQEVKINKNTSNLHQGLFNKVSTEDINKKDIDSNKNNISGKVPIKNSSIENTSNKPNSSNIIKNNDSKPNDDIVENTTEFHLYGD